MLCRSCRRSLLARMPFALQQNSRSASTQTSAASSTPSSRAPRPSPSIALPQSSTSSAAQSSATPGISQPFSTPLASSDASSSSPNLTDLSAGKEGGGGDGGKAPRRATRLAGSLPGGAVLQGIGYLKAKPAVYALEDDQYPEWLWTLLDKKGTTGTGAKAVDLASMTKKQRGKYDRKQERLNKNLPKKIPVHEQSTDLTKPGQERAAFVSLDKRQEITKSSRVARRKEIRESNFLRGM